MHTPTNTPCSGQDGIYWCPAVLQSNDGRWLSRMASLVWWKHNQDVITLLFVSFAGA